MDLHQGKRIDARHSDVCFRKDGLIPSVHTLDFDPADLPARLDLPHNVRRLFVLSGEVTVDGLEPTLIAGSEVTIEAGDDIRASAQSERVKVIIGRLFEDVKAIE